MVYCSPKIANIILAVYEETFLQVKGKQNINV